MSRFLIPLLTSSNRPLIESLGHPNDCQVVLFFIQLIRLMIKQDSMKRIIIPTRCTTHAVHLFQLAIKLYSKEGFHCTFLQVIPIPDNESDLMTLGRAPSGYVFEPKDLSAIKEMTNENPSIIKGYTIDQVYGDSPAVLKQFIEEYGVDMVFYAREEWQDQARKSGLDVFRMLCRARCPIMYVAKSELSEISAEFLQPQTRDYASAREMTDAVSRIHASKQPGMEIPETMVYQFNAVEKKLSGYADKMQSNDIPTMKMGGLSGYFLREQRLEKILLQSNASLLLLTI